MDEKIKRYINIANEYCDDPCGYGGSEGRIVKGIKHALTGISWTLIEIDRLKQKIDSEK